MSKQIQLAGHTVLLGGSLCLICRTLKGKRSCPLVLPVKARGWVHCKRMLVGAMMQLFHRGLVILSQSYPKWPWHIISLQFLLFYLLSQDRNILDSQGRLREELAE